MAMAKNWIAHLKFLFLCFPLYVGYSLDSNLTHWINVILFLEFLNNNIYNCSILLYSLGTLTWTEKEKKEKNWKQHITDKKTQLFIQAVLLMSIFEMLYFRMLYFKKKDHKIIPQWRWGSGGTVSFVAGPWWSPSGG